MPDNAPHNALHAYNATHTPIEAVEADTLPKNWRKWSDNRIERYLIANQDNLDDEVQVVMYDMQEELDDRDHERDLSPNWDAREGERPSWDV
jgi:hypothetical protein